MIRIDTRQWVLSLAIVGLASMACRPLPEGNPRYPEFEPIGAGADSLPGAFPWDGESPRLSFGAFYEGGSTDIIEIDGSVTNYFIYEGTYDQAETIDRVEGLVAAELTMTDAQVWFGGGVVYTSNFDLSEWTTLHASFKAPESEVAFESMDILIESDGGVSSRVKPVDFGFVADGEWHSVTIPLSLFAAVDFTQIRVPVSFVSDTGPTGAVLLIDDVFYTQE